jgi:hypothetical protein
MTNRINSPKVGQIVLLLRHWQFTEEQIQGLAGFCSFFGGAPSIHLEAWKSVPERSLCEWFSDIAFTIAAASIPSALYLIRESYRRSDSEELVEASALIKIKDSQIISWVTTGALIKELIKTKQERLRVQKKTMVGLIKAFANRDQPQLVLKIIYDQFKKGFGGKRMRVSVFGKSSAPYPHLEPLFSYDGKDVGCIVSTPESFRLDTDSENKAEVVKHFSAADHTFKLIGDCHSDPSFTHFKPSEKGLLKSMLLFKHKMESVDSSIILALDCDICGHFKNEMLEEYTHFVVEMMHRLEYELLALQVVQDTLVEVKKRKDRDRK